MLSAAEMRELIDQVRGLGEELAEVARRADALVIALDASGGWARIRAPHTSLREAVNICNKHADRVPDLPALAAFRPAVAPLPSARVPLSKTAPAPA
ncbi:hypothetical protein SALBM311S_01865 [Streptomyces alboniger]